MSDNAYNFEIPKHHKSIIKVIGVGGGGSNAVNHMFNQGIKDVEFVVCNTDSQALKSSPVPNRIQIGANLTEGLGAGANPEKGKNAALESKEDIRNLLDDDTKMVFITAGMGGGTGTGAAPVIAKVAKDMDVLTVGIVTVPFAFEGKKKMKQAQEGIEALKDNCDTVLVILNDKLREIYGNLSISEAFAKADNVLTTAAKGIAEIITVPGYVNVDFQDVKTVMYNAGAAVMGSAVAEGENRARRAAEAALVSPLLNNKEIHGAQKILLSIISGEQAELQMDELTEISEFIQETTGDDAEVIFGHGVDPDLGNNIRVTVIATGFDRNKPDNQLEESTDDEKKVFHLESNKQISMFNTSETAPVLNNLEKELDKKIIANEPPVPEEPVTIDSEFEQGYFFEPRIDDNDTDLFGDDADQPLEHDLQAMSGTSEPNNFELRTKQEILALKARERINRLKHIANDELKTGDIKEQLDVPAYMRKKVTLENVPHSSERNVSKYSLNDDSQILGNNKFLHDNVD